jgi:hypothetical protein
MLTRRYSLNRTRPAQEEGNYNRFRPKKKTREKKAISSEYMIESKKRVRGKKRKGKGSRRKRREPKT